MSNFLSVNDGKIVFSPHSGKDITFLCTEAGAKELGDYLYKNNFDGYMCSSSVDFGDDFPNGEWFDIGEIVGKVFDEAYAEATKYNCSEHKYVWQYKDGSFYRWPGDCLGVQSYKTAILRDAGLWDGYGEDGDGDGPPHKSSIPGSEEDGKWVKIKVSYELEQA